jgi:hypothetical protein
MYQVIGKSERINSLKMSMDGKRYAAYDKHQL